MRFKEKTSKKLLSTILATVMTSTVILGGISQSGISGGFVSKADEVINATPVEETSDKGDESNSGQQAQQPAEEGQKVTEANDVQKAETSELHSAQGEPVYEEEFTGQGPDAQEHPLDGDSVEKDAAADTGAVKALNGFVKQDGKWYFYKDNVQQRKWVEYNGNTYYFLNTYTLPQNMWRKIDGYLYYFNKDGVMIRDQKIKIDGKVYQFDSKGHQIPLNNSRNLGEVTPEQQKRYDLGAQTLIDAAKDPQNQNPQAKNGIYSEQGKWYRYVDGKRVRGWYTEGNKKYYFLNTLNRAENMFRRIQGSLYYFGKDGVMYSGTIKSVNGKIYKFGSDGKIDEKAVNSVITGDTRVISEPKQGAAVVGKLKKGTGVQVLATNGNYVKVANGNNSVVGWISKNNYLQPVQEKVNKVVSIAMSKIGSPYVWGATGPNSFDCSGLMLYAYLNGAGINLPRVSKYQATVGTYVSRGNLRPGDLIFWGNPVHHVAMYIGDGKYVHAPQPGMNVTTATLGTYTTARRVIQ